MFLKGKNRLRNLYECIAASIHGYLVRSNSYCNEITALTANNIITSMFLLGKKNRLKFVRKHCSINTIHGYLLCSTSYCNEITAFTTNVCLRGDNSIIIIIVIMKTEIRSRVSGKIKVMKKNMYKYCHITSGYILLVQRLSLQSS